MRTKCTNLTELNLLKKSPTPTRLCAIDSTFRIKDKKNNKKTKQRSPTEIWRTRRRTTRSRRNTFHVDYSWSSGVFFCGTSRDILENSARDVDQWFSGTLSETNRKCAEPWRIICTAAAAAAATGRLEVPCMMPCNTPLYKSMWRLFSLILACTRRYLIFIFTFFPSLTLIFSSWNRSFFSHLFSPKVHWLFIIV